MISRFFCIVTNLILFDCCQEVATVADEPAVTLATHLFLNRARVFPSPSFQLKTIGPPPAMHHEKTRETPATPGRHHVSFDFGRLESESKTFQGETFYN